MTLEECRARAAGIYTELRDDARTLTEARIAHAIAQAYLDGYTDASRFAMAQLETRMRESSARTLALVRPLSS